MAKQTHYNIFMVGGCPSYANWFPFDYKITENPEKADVAWWIGGCDVDPALYGETPGGRTFYSPQDSKYEKEMWDFFKDRDVFKIGTCKGHQNLAVFNGAKMVQHSNHPFYHLVTTNDGCKLHCISLHHQQVILDEKLTGLKDGTDYELVGWTTKLSPYHLGENDQNYNFAPDYKEPEIIWIDKTKCFLVQSHPEIMDLNSNFVRYCQNFVAKKLEA